MRDYTNPSHDTALKQPYSSWPPSQVGAQEEVEPFRKAPAPLPFDSRHILSQMTPDPLLTITPEKNARPRKSPPSIHSAHGAAVVHGNRASKSRQRVRFAPGTRTSPSMESVADGVDNRGQYSGPGEGVVARTQQEDDSVPRNFSAVSRHLYEPGRYAGNRDDDDDDDDDDDHDREEDDGDDEVEGRVETDAKDTSPFGAAELLSSLHALTAKTRELKERSGETDKPYTARVVRHLPRPSLPRHLPTADAEVEEITQRGVPTSTRRSLSRRSSSRSPGGSSSGSPVRNLSPSRSSPGGSAGRRTPLEFSTLLDEEEEAPRVAVVREAPPLLSEGQYFFPFQDDSGAKGYDPSSENPLARPEFNSTLKINQELAAVRSRRPDTWQAVTQQLNSGQQRRLQIQEKASSKVNVQRLSEQYSGLVQVSAPLEAICHSVEKEITLRAPPAKPPPGKVPAGKEPDLMEFFPPALVAELPDLTLTGIAAIPESLTTADPALALDLYRHNRAWCGLLDS